VFESRRQIFVRRLLHQSRIPGKCSRDEDPEGKVGFIELMLALAVTKLPEGGAWSYELELETINQDTDFIAKPPRACVVTGTLIEVIEAAIDSGF
jgi:hypothetical protein